MVLNTEWAQVEVIDLVNDGTGLGFVIIGGKSTGVVIKAIQAGAVADRDGRLQTSDHILQIGKHSLRGMESIQVAQVLRNAGNNVRLVVARPVETSCPDYEMENIPITPAPIVPTRLLANVDELENQIKTLQNAFPEPCAQDETVEEINEKNGHMNLEVSASIELPPCVSPDHSIVDASIIVPPDVETYSIELTKDAGGLGLMVAGYICDHEELSGIFIKSVSPGSAAELSGKVAVNDQIVEVDGCCLRGLTNYEAVEVLKATGEVVRLTLNRYISGPQYDQLQLSMFNDDSYPTTVASDSTDQQGLPDDDSSPEPTGSNVSLEATLFSTQAQVSTEAIELVLPAAVRSLPGGNDSYIEAVGRQALLDGLDESIDCEYGAVLNTDIEAATQSKWRKVLGKGYEIIVAQICKPDQMCGLGVSLEGTVHIENGEEVRPHHYIRCVLPEGPVGIDGRLRGGDELLEVNGQRLLGLKHAEVVSILKGIPTSLRMVCCRRSDDTTVSSLESLTQYGDRLELTSILDDSIGTPFSMERLIKAKSDSSLASSVTDTSVSRGRSRSMEPLSEMAMWTMVPQIVILEKGDHGLGFSVLDYQDPTNLNEAVIVIRSLVPGGVAELDGRLIPGDRLLFVNDVSLEHASLDSAVQALKGAPLGPVRLGVAKPLPLVSDSSLSQDLTVTLSRSGTEVDEENFGDNSSLSTSSLSSDAVRGVLP